MTLHIILHMARRTGSYCGAMTSLGACIVDDVMSPGAVSRNSVCDFGRIGFHARATSDDYDRQMFVLTHDVLDDVLHAISRGVLIGTRNGVCSQSIATLDYGLGSAHVIVSVECWDAFSEAMGRIPSKENLKLIEVGTLGVAPQGPIPVESHVRSKCVIS